MRVNKKLIEAKNDICYFPNFAPCSILKQVFYPIWKY